MKVKYAKACMGGHVGCGFCSPILATLRTRCSCLLNQDERTATRGPGNPLDQLTCRVDSMSHIVWAFHSTYASWMFLNGGEGGAFIQVGKRGREQEMPGIHNLEPCSHH